MITFKDKSFMISIGNTDLMIGYMERRLFWFDASIDLSSALHAHVMVAPTDIQIWHHRMGHLSYQALKRYQDSVKGMTFDSLIDHDHSSPCAGCEFGKQARPPFHASSKRSDWQLQIIHSDLARPMQVQSIQGRLYIATFVDDYSRHGVVYFLKSKDQCAAAFRKFLAWAENQTTDKMCVLHSDRGGSTYQVP